MLVLMSMQSSVMIWCLWTFCEWGEKEGVFKGCWKRKSLKSREVEKSRQEFLEGGGVKHSLCPKAKQEKLIIIAFGLLLLFIYFWDDSFFPSFLFFVYFNEYMYFVTRGKIAINISFKGMLLKRKHAVAQNFFLNFY